MAEPVSKFVSLIEQAKQEILEEVGDLSGIDVMYNQILVGIYKRPSITRGGIHIADMSKQEDVYQGKVALVLKVGPSAFADNDEFDFQGQKVAVGDWIVLRPGDGWQLKVRKRECRMLVDTSIKLKISEPDLVY